MDLISAASGNFTAASTWKTVDATSLLDSEAASTASTTSYVRSSGFTPGAITIDAFAIKVAIRSTTTTGTLTARLYNITDNTPAAGTAVTIDIVDITNTSLSSATNPGWILLKFGAPVVLLAGKSYGVELLTSTSGTVTVYRDATAGNWSRMLRTTTTQAPAASNNLHIICEFVSAGVKFPLTVTMDNTATTQFGLMDISSQGLLVWGTSAATNYYLKVNGNLVVWTEGTYTCGTSVTEIPSDSTAKLEFVCSSNVQYGFEIKNGAIISIYGDPITNKSALLGANYGGLCSTTNTGGNVVTRLSGPAFDTEFSPAGTIVINTVTYTINTVDSANQLKLTTAPGTQTAVGFIKPTTYTALTTDISTGWKSGDLVGIASTSRNLNECEQRTLSIDAAGTTLTLTVALGHYKGGVSPVVAEVVNLTRNVKIFSSSAVNQTYVNIQDATVAIKRCEFYNMGSSTTNKRGINLATINNTAVIEDCSWHDFNVSTSYGVFLSGATCNNFTINNCVSYNIYSSTVYVPATTGNNWTVIDTIGIKNILNSIFDFNDLGGNLYDLTAAGGAQGYNLTDAVNGGNIDGLTAHSNTSYGISFINTTCSPKNTYLNFTSWRNAASGMAHNNCFSYTIDGFIAFGNLTNNLTFISHCADIRFNNMVLNGGEHITTNYGFNCGGDLSRIFVDNSTFGATQEHILGDVNAVVNTLFDAVFRNCLLSSTNKLTNTNLMLPSSVIGFARYQQTAANHISYRLGGTIAVDNTIFNLAAPSARVTPVSISVGKLRSSIKKVAVANGGTVTIGAMIRKSVIGDGAAYNGAQPTLVLLADPAMGIAQDTVLATADNTYNGTFKLLSATTPVVTDYGALQFAIECDGTAGWINIDDWQL